MKLGLISDIHGDPLSLELAWSHLTIMGADRIVCAGDTVGYGPYPDRAVAFLTSRKIDCVRGNHDRWALQRGPGRRDEFGGSAPSAETLATLGTFPVDRPIESCGRIVLVAHGSPTSDMEYVVRKTHGPEVLDRLLADLGVDVLVVGHTHAPMWYRGERGLVVNPGSVISMPVVRTSRTFALLDVEALKVTFHDVESGRVLDVPHWD
ncbi:MAG: phosphoesterase, family [Planctomycetota bacterium]|nr:phosphoesterase, family [Planctomycetota bacterium]